MEETHRSQETEIKVEPPQFPAHCQELDEKDEHYENRDNPMTADGIKTEPPELESVELESGSVELESESAELESESAELESGSVELESGSVKSESESAELENGESGDEVKVEKVSFIADSFTESNADDNRQKKRTSAYTWLNRPVSKIKLRQEAKVVQQNVYRSAMVYESKNCNICGVRCLNMDFYKQHMIHHKRVNKCKSCHLLFESAAILKEHSKNCDVNRSETYRCKDCLVVYRTLKGIELHRKFCKKGGTAKKSSELEAIEGVVYAYPSAPIREINVNRCLVCKKKFMFRSSLEEHRLVCGKQSTAVSSLENQYISSADLSTNLTTVANEESSSDNEIDEESLYKCTECDEVFSETVRLKLHMKRNHTANKKKLKTREYPSSPNCDENVNRCLVCLVCKKKFMFVSSFEKHILICSKQSSLQNQDKSSMDLSETFTPTMSDNSTDMLEINEESSSDNEITEKTLYKCTECDEVFTEISTLKSHMKNHAENENRRKNEISRGRRSHKVLKTRSIECPDCSRTFTSTRYLNIHKNIHTRIYSYKRTAADKGKIKSYDCKDCDMIFEDAVALKYHRKTHSGLASKGKQRWDKDKDVKRCQLIAKKTRQPGHVCKECGIIFEDVSSLISHRLRNSKTKVLNKEAKEAEERSESRVKCPKCERIFDNKRCLKHHMVRAHVEKPSTVSQTCKECGRVFNDLRCLIVHMKTHSNDRNFRRIQQDGAYKCKECGQGFAKSYILEQHMTTHANSNNGNLNLHIKNHPDSLQGSKCQMCHKLFQDSTSLRYHMRCVHGVRDYTQCEGRGVSEVIRCEVCGLTTTSPTGMKIHMTVVHGGGQSGPGVKTEDS